MAWKRGRDPDPTFTPEEQSTIADINRRYLDSMKGSDEPAPIAKPLTPGLGMQTGKAGGFWYARGGKVLSSKSW
jgi:hypothetical protein